MNFKNLIESNNKGLVFSDESEREVKEFSEDNNLDKRQISILQDSNGDYEYVIAYKTIGVKYDCSFTVLRKDHNGWTTFDKQQHFLSIYSDQDKVLKDYLKEYKDRVSGFQNSEFYFKKNTFKVNREVKDFETLEINSREWDEVVSNSGFRIDN